MFATELFVVLSGMGVVYGFLLVLILGMGASSALARRWDPLDVSEPPPPPEDGAVRAAVAAWVASRFEEDP